jgi:hypothetical protein
MWHVPGVRRTTQGRLPAQDQFRLANDHCRTIASPKPPLTKGASAIPALPLCGGLFALRRRDFG